MARFVFELEAVLKQRLVVERTRQRALAAIERERVVLEDSLRACQGQIRTEKDELRAALCASGEGQPVDLRGVRMQAGASLTLAARARQIVLKIAGTMRRVEAARALLLEATTRRKAVETLRERRLAAWNEVQRRREDAAIDEIAVMRGARAEEVA